MRGCFFLRGGGGPLTTRPTTYCMNDELCLNARVVPPVRHSVSPNSAAETLCDDSSKYEHSRLMQLSEVSILISVIRCSNPYFETDFRIHVLNTGDTSLVA